MNGARFGPGQASQANLLNAYLDGLTRGGEPLVGGLDPALAATVSQVRALEEAALSGLARADEVPQLWRNLMQMQPMTRLTALPSLSTDFAQAERTPVRVHRGVAPRRFQLIAMFALVLVVAISTAVFAWHRRDDIRDPATLPAVAAPVTVTSAADPTSAPVRSPEFGTTDVGTLWVRPVIEDCSSVAPMSYDSIMETIVGRSYPFDTMPPFPQIAQLGPGPNSTVQYSFGRLPAGTSVSEDVITAAAKSYGLYIGCQEVGLRQATVFTPGGLAKQYWEAPSIFLQDGGPDGDRLAWLWFDESGRQYVDVENTHTGELSDVYLYDFRQLPDGKIAAFYSSPKGVDRHLLPTFYEDAGYVLFAEQDGLWLIDEQFVR